MTSAATSQPRKEKLYLEPGHYSKCSICDDGGVLVECESEGCGVVCHPACVGLTEASLPEGKWFCPDMHAIPAGTDANIDSPLDLFCKFCSGAGARIVRL